MLEKFYFIGITIKISASLQYIYHHIIIFNRVLLVINFYIKGNLDRNGYKKDIFANMQMKIICDNSVNIKKIMLLQ